MVHCIACDKNMHPIVDMGENGRLVKFCSNPECKAPIGVVEVAPPPPRKMPVEAEQHPVGATSDGPAVPTSTRGPARTKNEPLDLIAEARKRRDHIDERLTELAGLQRERRRLDAMIRAAEAADEELPHAAE